MKIYAGSQSRSVHVNNGFRGSSGKDGKGRTYVERPSSYSKVDDRAQSKQEESPLAAMQRKVFELAMQAGAHLNRRG